MTLYRDIISKALELSWRHRYLWFLSFFAALAGNGGEYQLAFSGSDSISGQSYILGLLRAFYANGGLHAIIQNIQNFFGKYPLPTIFFTLLLLLLAILLVWIIVIAQAALVWSIAQWNGKKTVTFPEAFSMGAKYFSPVFLINLVTELVILGLIFVIALPLGIAYIRTGVTLYNSLYILMVFIALVPVAMLLSFIVKYATVYAVIRNQAWRTALKNGWTLFFRNWLASLEVAFVLFAINLVTSLILTYFLLLLGLTSNSAGTLIFFVILMVFGAFIATFQYSSWVQLFFELEKGTVRPKLLRWADRLTHKSTAPAIK